MKIKVFTKKLKELGIDLTKNTLVYTIHKQLQIENDMNIVLDIEVDYSNENVLYCSAIIKCCKFENKIDTHDADNFIRLLKSLIE